MWPSLNPGCVGTHGEFPVGRLRKSLTVDPASCVGQGESKVKVSSLFPASQFECTALTLLSVIPLPLLLS